VANVWFAATRMMFELLNTVVYTIWPLLLVAVPV
jgi:hypothetical protein